MKIVKYLFFLLLLVFIGSAIYFGTKDGKFNVENQTVVEAPVSVVFKEVNHLDRWEKWGPWKKEKDFHFTQAEKTSGEGAAVKWTGKDKGNLTTTKVIPDQKIEQEISYHTFFGERTAQMTWTFTPLNHQETEIQWTIQGSHNLMDKIYFALSRKDFDADWIARQKKSIAGMEDSVVEAMQAYSFNVDGITHYGGGYYMYNSAVSKQQDIHKRMLPMLDQVKAFMEKNNIRKAGEPFILYNEIDSSNNVIFSAGIPVREQVITPESSSIVASFLKPLTAVKVSLKGAYNHIPEAHSLARAYIRENGYEEDTHKKPFEIFSVNQDDTLNPAEWITEIYIPIVSEEIEDTGEYD